MQKKWDCNDDSIKFVYCYMALLSVRNYWRITNKIFDNIIKSGAIDLCMNYFGAIETRLKTNYCLKQFVKMVKDGQHAGSKTNFPCDATFYNFRNGRQEKVNTPDLNVKICCNRDQKKNNKHSNKQTMLIRFFRTWINWLHWTKYIVMLYLHGFCYFAVSFQFTERSWCLSNIYIEALYSWSTRGFLINPKFGINSSRKHVKNFCVTEIRYVYQRKYSKSESFFIRTPKTWI